MLLVTACGEKRQAAKITETDTDQHYELVAAYNPDATVSMQQYVNKTLAPNRIFVDHADHVDQKIKLVDGTVFTLKSAPGDLTIQIDKRKNSAQAVANLKKLCTEIRKVIEE